jgi:hypothetical protein
MRTDTNSGNTNSAANTDANASNCHPVADAANAYTDTDLTNSNSDSNPDGHTDSGNSNALAESVAGDSSHQPINSYER